MALDPSFVGRTYPPTPEYDVGREKIREFASAIGDDNPVYLDVDVARELGHPDLLAPPTFAIVMSMHAGHQVVFDPELRLNYSRVLHGEQRFVHHRPIHAGDRLRCVVVVDNIRSAAGNDILSTRTEITSVEGEPVCTAYSTLVARGQEAR